MTKKPHDPTFTIDTYVSGDKGTRFSVEPAGQIEELLSEDSEVFNFNKYAESVSLPFPLPQIDATVLADEFPRCLDMPLRFAGEEEYSVPEEWEGLLPLIKQIIGTEHVNNANWKDYNTYITVDCKEVAPDEQQRHGGLHVDGFQGARIDPKTRITRNYVVTTNGGTRFYNQPFIVVDETKYNVFQGFDLQAKDYFIADENVVHFMNAYTVHESGIASRRGLRTFLRVTYDIKAFDRKGNTHNSMLKYNWDMVARNVHEQVATPTLEDIANSPHL